MNYDICNSMMHLGDIIICPRYAEYVMACDIHGKNIKQYEEWSDKGASGVIKDVKDLNRRCDILLLHGILHLIGYDHVNGEKEKDIMEELERRGIEGIGL